MDERIEKRDIRPRRGRRPASAVSGREALVRAANVCFQRAGYAASLRDIAMEAGVDMALVGRLFGSKEKLWEAVVRWHEDQLARHFKDVDALEQAGRPAAEALGRLLTLNAEFCVDCPGFIALLLHEATNRQPRLGEIIVRRLLAPLHERYLPFVRRAMEEKAIVAEDAGLALAMMLSGIRVSLAAPLLCGCGGGEADLAKRLAREAQLLWLRKTVE